MADIYEKKAAGDQQHHTTGNEFNILTLCLWFIYITKIYGT